MNQQSLIRNGTRVDMLYRSIREGAAGLKDVPGLVRQILEDEMWREHLYEKTGEVFRFDSFKEFVEMHPPDGLGTTIETLIRLCADDPLVVDMIDAEVQGTAGGDKKSDEYKSKTIVDNVNNDFDNQRPTGNTRRYGLRKLRKYAESNPQIEQLRQAVLANEMSVNRALVEAGLRTKQFTVIKDPEKAAQTLKKNFSERELEKLIDLLSR